MTVKSNATAKREKFLVSWLRLARTKGIGSRTFIELMKVFKDPEIAIKELPNLAKRGGKADIKVATSSSVLREIDETMKFGAQIILSCDKEYPQILKTIQDYPPVITAKGRINLLATNKVAIVGSRNSSINGNKIAYILSRDVGKAGLITISGLARGIDSSAHKGSLESGTIAVIGAGIKNIYPKDNESLYHELYEKGLVITEQSFDQSPSPEHFPQRNRIISGLALGVVVIEAMQKSGTLITTRFAADQGREVFAVPGSPLDPKSQGTNMLIKDGAILVQSAEDIISPISNIIDKQSMLSEEFDVTNFRAPKFNTIESESDLSDARSFVMTKLSHAPVDIADIISEAAMPSNLINIAILELELAGKVERTYGNKVTLIAC